MEKCRREVCREVLWRSVVVVWYCFCGVVFFFGFVVVFGCVFILGFGCAYGFVL